MFVVMKTRGPDSGNRAIYHNYDYAIFKMETVEARLLMQKFNVFKLNKTSDPLLTDMMFNVMDCQELSCEFYDCAIWDDDEKDIMPTGVRRDLDDQGWSIIESLDKDITPRDAHTPGFIFLGICVLGWFWRARPLKDNVHVETEILPFELLQRVL